MYATLPGKANILRAVVELTVRGDDDTAPLASRAAWQDIERQDDPPQRLALFTRLHRQICDRDAAVFAQLEAAAGTDEETTELLAEFDRRRLRDAVARDLRPAQPRAAAIGTSREQAAADSLWTLASERTYLALVRNREWNPADYERWLIEQLAAAVLPHGSPQATVPHALEITELRAVTRKVVETARETLPIREGFAEQRRDDGHWTAQIVADAVGAARRVHLITS